MSYRFDEKTPGMMIWVNGQKLSEKSGLEDLVTYLEGLGLKRLDHEEQ